jgi:TolB protein
MLVVICCMAGIAMADEKNILVTSGSDRATPIAVVPFGWQGGSVLPDDMAEIIGNDLRNSGYYSPIPRQNMISQPSQASEIIFRDWKALGAQYVMVGSIVPAGGRLQVQYALFNVATEQQVLTGSVSVAPTNCVTWRTTSPTSRSKNSPVSKVRSRLVCCT